MFRQKLFSVLLLLVACPSALLAQQSGIVGTVTDSSGAVLAGVSVTAKNVNTGETRQATSNDVGAVCDAEPASRNLQGKRGEARFSAQGC